MALFSSPERKTHREPRAHRGADPEPVLSIVGADLRIEGDLHAGGAVRIDGTVVGRVQAEGQVLVTDGGIVEGDIHTHEAILGGEVRGSVVAERVELTATSVIQGDITTTRLLVHEGATLCGHIRVPKSEVASEPTAGWWSLETGRGSADARLPTPTHASPVLTQAASADPRTDDDAGFGAPLPAVRHGTKHTESSGSRWGNDARVRHLWTDHDRHTPRA